jgi:hypothetical protein
MLSTLANNGGKLCVVVLGSAYSRTAADQVHWLRESMNLKAIPSLTRREKLHSLSHEPNGAQVISELEESFLRLIL